MLSRYRARGQIGSLEHSPTYPKLLFCRSSRRAHRVRASSLQSRHAPFPFRASSVFQSGERVLTSQLIRSPHRSHLAFNVMRALELPSEWNGTQVAELGGAIASIGRQKGKRRPETGHLFSGPAVGESRRNGTPAPAFFAGGRDQWPVLCGIGMLRAKKKRRRRRERTRPLCRVSGEHTLHNARPDA
jgi:hypothetical protein